jgi:sortase A
MAKNSGNKKKHRLSNWLWSIFLIIGFAISLVLIFNEPIKLWVIGQKSEDATRSAQTLKSTDYTKNKTKKANFKFSSVKALDLSNVSKSALQRNLHPIGLIAVPSVKIYLPVLNGLGNNNLTVGAGTMKPNQVMGERNYALAGHHIHKQPTLFSPLENVKVGSKIYVTDKKKVYTYKITFEKVVDKSQVQYIDDAQGNHIITLVTCAADQILQPERQIVRGKLVKVTNASDRHLRVFMENK